MQKVIERLKNIKRDEEALKIIMESIIIANMKIKKHKQFKNEAPTDSYIKTLKVLEGEKKRLVANYELISAEFAATKAALATLSDIENSIAYCFFIDKKLYGVEILGEKVGYSRSWLYREKQKVVSKLCKLLYGCEDK